MKVSRRNKLPGSSTRKYLCDFEQVDGLDNLPLVVDDLLPVARLAVAARPRGVLDQRDEQDEQIVSVGDSTDDA